MIAALLCAGTSLSAWAQTVQQQAAVDPGPGLVGTTYSEVEAGYQKQQGNPSHVRDLGFAYNQAIQKSGDWGLDANFSYAYLTGNAYGTRDYRNDAEVGLTAFMMQPWGKPFVTADGGYAWQNAGDVSRKGFIYTLTGGVEFQVLRDLALTPFMEYQAEPKFYNHERPVANFPDYGWDYGVKATYRFTREWSASVTLDLDQYSGSDLGVRAGVEYKF